MDMEYEKAIVVFSQIIELEPKNIEAYLGLAHAYEAIRESEKALEILENARTAMLDRDSEEAGLPEAGVELYVTLARLYEEQGEHDRAIEMIAEGLRLFESDVLMEMWNQYSETGYGEILSEESADSKAAAESSDDVTETEDDSITMYFSFEKLGAGLTDSYNDNNVHFSFKDEQELLSGKIEVFSDKCLESHDFNEIH